MIAIRSVVCPVDFSPATTRQVDLASDVCRAFGARLILHHNVSDLSVGAAVGWMWHADHEPVDPAAVDDRMRNLISSVPAGVEVEGCITRGAVTEGTSALFLMTSEAVLDRVADAMKGTKFEIMATNLSKEQEEKLREAFAQ
jgi:hypothetical protein